MVSGSRHMRASLTLVNSEEGRWQSVILGVAITRCGHIERSQSTVLGRSMVRYLHIDPMVSGLNLTSAKPSLKIRRVTSSL